MQQHLAGWDWKSHLLYNYSSVYYITETTYNNRKDLLIWLNTVELTKSPLILSQNTHLQSVDISRYFSNHDLNWYKIIKYYPPPNSYKDLLSLLKLVCYFSMIGQYKYLVLICPYKRKLNYLKNILFIMKYIKSAIFSYKWWHGVWYF